MNFRIRLKKTKRPKNTRIKFDLDKLKDPTICEVFQATIGGNFAPLLLLEEDAEVLTNTFNSIMTDTAKEVLGNQRKKKKPWVNDDILRMCDARREPKNTRHSTGKAEYSEINKKIRKKHDTIERRLGGTEVTEIETNLVNNNSKKAFQIVKDLTKQELSSASTMHDKKGDALLKVMTSQPDGRSTAESSIITQHKETLKFLIPKNQPTMMTFPFSEKK